MGSELTLDFTLYCWMGAAHSLYKLGAGSQQFFWLRPWIMICKLPGPTDISYIFLKNPDGRFLTGTKNEFRTSAVFSVQTIIIKSTKSTYPVSSFLHLEYLRPHTISLTLLSQDSINESISPLPEPSPYLLKTKFQERQSKKKKKRNKQIK